MWSRWVRSLLLFSWTVVMEWGARVQGRDLGSERWADGHQHQSTCGSRCGKSPRLTPCGPSLRVQTSRLAFTGSVSESSCTQVPCKLAVLCPHPSLSIEAHRAWHQRSYWTLQLCHVFTKASTTVGEVVWFSSSFLCGFCPLLCAFLLP